MNGSDRLASARRSSVSDRVEGGILMASVMQSLVVALCFVAAPPAKAKAPETAADAVTLRDGKVVLGQVVDPSPRGMLRMLIRRAWALAELPDRAARWQADESATLGRARAQRR